MSTNYGVKLAVHPNAGCTVSSDAMDIFIKLETNEWDFLSLALTAEEALLICSSLQSAIRDVIETMKAENE